MKKILLILTLGLMFGQTELTTRVYDFSDGVYEQQYDVKNAVIYDVFYECLAELNKRAKEKRISKLDLPKLKKVISDAEKVQS